MLLDYQLDPDSTSTNGGYNAPVNEDLAQAALDTINALNARVKMLEAKLAEPSSSARGRPARRPHARSAAPSGPCARG